MSVDFLDLVNSCLCTNIRKLSRIVTRLYDAELKQTPLNINQLGIMLTISGLEEPYIGDLAEKLVMEKSTLSRNLGVLEEMGFIIIKINTMKKSQKIVSVTQSGMNAITQSYPPWDNIQRKISSSFGNERFLQAIQLLNQLETSLNDL